MSALCRFLGDSHASPLLRYTPSNEDRDSVFDLRAVFQQRHSDVNLELLPPLLVPRKGKHALRDYEKAFSADLKSGQDIFDLRGIDRLKGALVVVRPDQYIAHVLPLDAHIELASFFDGFLLSVDSGQP